MRRVRGSIDIKSKDSCQRWAKDLDAKEGGDSYGSDLAGLFATTGFSRPKMGWSPRQKPS